MTQYDVYRSRSAADGIPCMVVVQSDLLDGLTMPLAVPEAGLEVPTAPCPVILAAGQRLQTLAHYATPLPAKSLRRPVDYVAAQASALVAALDAVLSRI